MTLRTETGPVTHTGRLIALGLTDLDCGGSDVSGPVQRQEQHAIVVTENEVVGTDPMPPDVRNGQRFRELRLSRWGPAGNAP